MFVILDLSNAHVAFQDIMRGAKGAFLGDNPTMKHPNVRQIMLVSDDETLSMAAQGMDSAIFGNIKIQRFTTLDEALAYARPTH